MKYAVFTMICALLYAPVSSLGQEQTSDTETKEVRQEPEVRKLLRLGKKTKSLPENMVVRVHAELWRSESGKKRFKEAWEFTSRKVHRVEILSPKKAGDEIGFRRVESVDFDTNSICVDLVNGRLFSIADEEGMGEGLHFVGTDYRAGSREIQILVDEKVALSVVESCLFGGFPETDARAFADLYELLASKARKTIDSKREK